MNSFRHIFFKGIRSRVNNKKRYVSTISIKTAISLFACFTGCVWPCSSQKNSLTEPKELFSDTITIGSEPNYPPYCIIDENGNADGFSVELFKAAARAVGMEVKIKVDIWNQIKQDLNDGKIDALPLVGRTPEREEWFDFTMPYLSLHGAIFVRTETSDIQSLSDLEEKEIVVMKGDNAEEFVRRENISDKIYTTNTFEEAFIQLAAGRHDAVITQRITGIELLKKLNIKSVVPLPVQIPSFRQDFCFAVREGNAPLLNRLNEGLSIVITNDTFEEIRNKWFGPESTEKQLSQNLLKAGLFILIPLILILIVFWIVFLRREVSRRTKRLNNEIAERKKTLEILKEQQDLLKSSKEQIRLLLDSTAEGIYGIDLNGCCIFMNQSGLEALGYTDMQQVIGKNMHRLIHHTKNDGSKYEEKACKIYQAFKENRGTHSDDEVLWRADGTSFPVEYFSYPFRKNGKITGSVVTFWDISHRKKAEAELIGLKDELEKQVTQRTNELEEKVQKLDKSQKAMLYMVEDLNSITAELKDGRRKLQLANQELEAFTYSVSHDLRAPLRAINGFSNFLMEDYADQLDDEGKRFINTIRDNATKMDMLISDLLNLSRVSRTNLSLGKIDITETVRSVYHDIVTQKEQETFEFIIHKMPAVECDLNLMKQVWQNLIENAVKYSSKSETKKIEIGTREKKKEITFYIKDWGAGFDEKYKDKLFGVFQRLHPDQEFAGTGVGLAVVQRIIKRHGGKVWAKGEPNRGATFYFSLPKE
ncbi:PAS domain S-box protein [Mariniphaga sediminis]|uniref:histidine kinase n=1 Tax=Mariniphaga sediminis TaxID=1628158 RepID=A0A399CYK6_9BACT|nr:transporter substrate-binding domain-containing protein [Mariniphaga sediminis]RIH63150.1 PAS domain S-box protein [Mariniphaga sediminis]